MIKKKFIVDFFRKSDSKTKLKIIEFFINYCKNIVIIHNVLQNSKYDLDVFHKLVPNDTTNYDNSNKHAKLLYKLIPKYIKSKEKKTILDFGCGHCMLGDSLRKLLKESKYYGVDIENWAEDFKHDNPNLKFTYITSDTKLPFNDNKFDVIIVSMVLHHIQNPHFVIDELYRILKKDGVILIREHDAFDDIDKTLIEIQHIIYMYITYKDKYIDRNIDYYSDYKSVKDWLNILKKKNLKCKFFIEYDKKIIVKTMRQFIILATK